MAWADVRGQMLKPYLMKIGYYRVSFGVVEHQYIHRLVAEAFIPNPQNCRKHAACFQGQGHVSRQCWPFLLEYLMGPYEAALRQEARERRQRLMFPPQGRKECEELSELLVVKPVKLSSCLPALSPALSSSIISPTKPRLTIHAVKARVAAAFGISTKNKRIWLQRRSERMYSPRNVAMALAREMVPEASFMKITQAFGEKHHSMVLRACRSVEARAVTDDEFSAMLWGLRAMLRENFNINTGEGNGTD